MTAPELGLSYAAWYKSTYSTYNGACIEIAKLSGGLIGVRDSKDGAARDVLVFDQADWGEFVSGIKRS